MRKVSKLPADFTLFVTTMILFAIGILIVFDASFALAADMKMTDGDSWYFVKRQFVFGVAGLLAMFIAMRVRLETVRKWSLPLMLLSIMLLGVVMVPGVGMRVNGATRWLGYGPLRFQPSELAKFAVVLYMAAALSNQKFRIWKFQSGILLHLVFVGLVAGLVFVEPDMGTASLIVINALVMLFVAGALKRHLAFLAGAGAIGGSLLIIMEPYRLARLTTFLHPNRDYYGDGYQVIHSLIALGSGGLLGTGICEGREKFYLPAAQTDFIFSTLGEEAGLLGAIAVVALFMLFTYRGLSIANRVKSPYHTLLAAGLTSMVGVQAIINIAVVTATMPATGVPLPFLSYGGSALMLTLTAAGLLLNVSRNVYAAAEPEVGDRNEDYIDRRRNRRAHISRSQYSRRSPVRKSGSRAAVRR
ncbi:MAG: putative lipid II flippase FtsW [Armatimonadota bacterium]|nr:putative lipid II flippase FtsW [Armatimonadota bacterium]